MKSKKMFQVLAIVVALIFVGAAGVMAQGTASTPVSDGGITPYIIPTFDPQGSGGNRTCDEVAAAFDTPFEYSTGKFNYDFNENFKNNFLPEFQVTVTDNTFVSWEPIAGDWMNDGDLYIPCNVAAIVKGGNDANVYYYGEEWEGGDSGLASPPAGEGFAGLSNLTFCYNLCEFTEPPPECEWIGETAWAAGKRYVTRGNWATYTQYTSSAKSVTLYAGQTMEAGTVYFSAPEGSVVYITITLNDGWRFEDVGENVKIQDYANKPSGNPAPGRFAHKTKADTDSKTITIPVPLNNFYGVHVNVEWEDCE